MRPHCRPRLECRYTRLHASPLITSPLAAFPPGEGRKLPFGLLTIPSLIGSLALLLNWHSCRRNRAYLYFASHGKWLDREASAAKYPSLSQRRLISPPASDTIEYFIQFSTTLLLF